MNIKDVNRILGIHPALVDRELPSDGRTFHLMSDPDLPFEDLPMDEAELRFSDGMRLLKKGDIQNGRRLLEEAYKMGNLEAGNCLALGLKHGWLGDRDYETAAKIFRKLAHKGESNAMNFYAFAYKDGLGVKKSIYWSEFWLLKAIEKGNLCAAATYGQLIIENVYPKQSKSLGLWLLFWAADNGVASAMNDIGLCYEEGVGMHVDYKKAFEWFKKAVDYGGGACAEFNLSRCYRYGLGEEIDYEQADAWQNLAIEHGFDMDAYNKAHCLDMDFLDEVYDF